MGVLQVFDTFYEPVSNRAQPQPGDVYWVPVPSVEVSPKVLEANRVDPRTHDVIDYTICQIANHHFTRRQERLPIKLLKLEATEELLVAKAKKRPAIVLCSCGIDDMSKLPKPEQRPAKAAGKQTYYVCPLYSTSTIAAPGTFMPTVVARIRALRYPHLACLPRVGKNETKPGQVARLDRLYLTHLQMGCKFAGWCLHKDVLKLIRDQLSWTAFGESTEYLRSVAQLAGETLPDELAQPIPPSRRSDSL